MQVNAETLQERIKYLELCKLTPVLGISINESYQLEAYKLLLDYMDKYAELQERYDLDVNPEAK